MKIKLISIFRIVALALFVFVIVGVFVRYRTGDDTMVRSPVVLTEGDTIERMIVLDDRDKAIMSGAGLPKLAYVAPVTGDTLLQDVTEVDFLEVYDQARRGDDVRRQLLILQDVYTQTSNPELLPYLVNLALQVRDYPTALVYMQTLEQSGTLFRVLDAATIFRLLFNGLELSFKDIAYIKDIILTYQQQQDISVAQTQVRNALVTYARGDMDNYAYFMEQLSGSTVDMRYREYLANVTATKAYTDVPVYYLDALTALQVFSHGYYQVARVGAERSIALDEEYILPRQVHGYASLMLSDWAQVITDMQWLREKDDTNEQLYTFLAGVAHIELEQYPEAILLLRDIRDEQFLLDAQRYLLLAYEALEEYTAMEMILEHLLVNEDILPHDFYTIFDLFFYKPLRKGEDVVLYATYFDLAERYIRACYNMLGQEYAYICLRGKSGLMIANGKDEQAYRYLERLVRWYPKDFLYTTLGDLAYDQELYTEAKKWFAHSLAATDDASMRQALIGKIRSTILGEK